MTELEQAVVKALQEDVDYMRELREEGTTGYVMDYEKERFKYEFPFAQRIIGKDIVIKNWIVSIKEN